MEKKTTTQVIPWSLANGRKQKYFSSWSLDTVSRQVELYGRLFAVFVVGRSWSSWMFTRPSWSSSPRSWSSCSSSTSTRWWTQLCRTISPTTGLCWLGNMDVAPRVPNHQLMLAGNFNDYPLISANWIAQITLIGYLWLIDGFAIRGLGHIGFWVLALVGSEF